jgi:hypothetical protein
MAIFSLKSFANSLGELMMNSPSKLLIEITPRHLQKSTENEEINLRF